MNRSGGLSARFIEDPLKVSGNSARSDLPSRERWFDYSRARDQMLDVTDTKVAPQRCAIRREERARLQLHQPPLGLIPIQKIPEAEDQTA